MADPGPRQVPIYREDTETSRIHQSDPRNYLMLTLFIKTQKAQVGPTERGEMHESTMTQGLLHNGSVVRSFTLTSCTGKQRMATPV